MKLPAVRACLTAAGGLWFGAVLFFFARSGGVAHLSPVSLEGGRPAAWVSGAGAVLAALACCFFFRALGVRLLRALGPAPSDPLLDGAFAFALGAGAWGMGMLLLGALQLWRPWTVAAATAAAGLAAGKDAWKIDFKGWRTLLPDGWSRAWAAVTAMSLGLLGLWCLAPETFYDALAYHLALPDLYRLEGGLRPVPGNFFSGFPQLAEMLYGWVLFGGDDRLARLLHLAAGAAAAAGIVGLARRERNVLGGWLAAGMLLTTPLLGMVLRKSGVEGFSVLFMVLSFAALSLRGRSALALAGLLAGFAMGVKYVNWPAPVAAAAWLTYRRAPLRDIGLFLAVAAATAAPWALKDLLFFGNPLYPYLHAGGDVDWKSWMADARGGGAAPWTALWRASTAGRTDENFLGPLFLAGLPFLPRGASGPGTRATAAGAAAAALWILPATANFRFFAAGLALAAPAWGLGLSSLKGRFRNAVLALALVAAINNAAWSWIAAARQGAWPVLWGAESGEEYLRSSHPTYPAPARAAAAWINDNAAPGDRVLVVGDARSYGLKRPFEAGSVFDVPPLLKRLRAAPTADALREGLERDGVRFLLVNVAEMQRAPGRWDPSAEEQKSLSEFLEEWTRKRFQDSNTVFPDYRLSVVREIMKERKNP